MAAFPLRGVGLPHDGRRRVERPPHLQIALPQAACEQVYTYDSGYRDSTANLARVYLSSDYVFGDGWDAELATVTGTPADGMAVTLTIGVGEAKAAPVIDPDAFHGQGTAPSP